VFFPWSLLFYIVFLELEDTKFFIIALVHDFLKTLIAVLSIILPIPALELDIHQSTILGTNCDLFPLALLIFLLFFHLSDPCPLVFVSLFFTPRNEPLEKS